MKKEIESGQDVFDRVYEPEVTEDLVFGKAESGENEKSERAYEEGTIDGGELEYGADIDERSDEGNATVEDADAIDETYDEFMERYSKERYGPVHAARSVSCSTQRTECLSQKNSISPSRGISGKSSSSCLITSREMVLKQPGNGMFYFACNSDARHSM